ncbi:MAG: phosphoribosylformylglycinamidine synthase, partial [Phycisphaeraceae bacterium]
MARCLVIRTAGTNCEAEMQRAFELAGARVEVVHVDRLIREPGMLDGFELIGFPGGFSYGDDIAAGRVLAVRLRERLWGALRSAAERGACMIGVCNGFQVMTQVGLLPGPTGAVGSVPTKAPTPTVALAENAGGRFVDRWVRMELGAGAERCVWTRGLVEHGGDGALMMLPIAHGEGRFVGSEEVVAGLVSSGRAVLRYAEGDDPNGSMAR